MDGVTPSLSLLVRRLVRGTPEAVFKAWTEPEQVMQWWGPVNVHCAECTIELRVGGGYRIANRLPDDSIIWITGEFLRVEPPHLIEYTWRRGLETEADRQRNERVTVRFSERANRTEVTVAHTRIADQSDYESHQFGWTGCLDGLAGYLDYA
ncbi:MAG: SRPBCC domain-containing protein [Alphaproteobacteria bacterium]|nr:SRPBCC domain-containing protein [Alphaproteobacteria bacterium]